MTRTNALIKSLFILKDDAERRGLSALAEIYGYAIMRAFMRGGDSLELWPGWNDRRISGE